MLVPDLLGDPDNNTPYQARGVLSTYIAVLLSIPSKLAGVWALILSVLVLALFPMLHTSKEHSVTFQTLSQSLFLSTSSRPLNTNMNLRITHRIPLHYCQTTSITEK